MLGLIVWLSDQTAASRSSSRPRRPGRPARRAAPRSCRRAVPRSCAPSSSLHHRQRLAELTASPALARKAITLPGIGAVSRRPRPRPSPAWAMRSISVATAEPLGANTATCSPGIHRERPAPAVDRHVVPVRARVRGRERPARLPTTSVSVAPCARSSVTAWCLPPTSDVEALRCATPCRESRPPRPRIGRHARPHPTPAATTTPDDALQRRWSRARTARARSRSISAVSRSAVANARVRRRRGAGRRRWSAGRRCVCASAASRRAPAPARGCRPRRSAWRSSSRRSGEIASPSPKPASRGAPGWIVERFAVGIAPEGDVLRPAQTASAADGGHEVLQVRVLGADARLDGVAADHQVRPARAAAARRRRRAIATPPGPAR